VHDNPGAGVLVRAGGHARLVHDVIEDNGRSAGGRAAGVELERGARAELEGNLIVGNAAAGVRGAPRRSHGALLSRNRFEHGGRSNPHAVVVEPAR
jgi:hypothetical protein